MTKDGAVHQCAHQKGHALEHERLPADGTIWPYGPSDFHEDVCRLQIHRGRGFCDCKASDASDTEWGMGA